MPLPLALLSASPTSPHQPLTINPTNAPKASRMQLQTSDKARQQSTTKLGTIYSLKRAFACAPHPHYIMTSFLHRQYLPAVRCCAVRCRHHHNTTRCGGRSCDCGVAGCGASYVYLVGSEGAQRRCCVGSTIQLTAGVRYPILRPQGLSALQNQVAGYGTMPYN